MHAAFGGESGHHGRAAAFAFCYHHKARCVTELAGFSHSAESDGVGDGVHIVVPLGQDHGDGQGIDVSQQSDAERQGEPRATVAGPEDVGDARAQNHAEGAAAPRVVARVPTELSHVEQVNTDLHHDER
jgi:hypothetical protein